MKNKKPKIKVIKVKTKNVNSGDIGTGKPWKCWKYLTYSRSDIYLFLLPPLTYLYHLLPTPKQGRGFFFSAGGNYFERVSLYGAFVLKFVIIVIF